MGRDKSSPLTACQDKTWVLMTHVTCCKPRQCQALNTGLVGLFKWPFNRLLHHTLLGSNTAQKCASEHPHLHVIPTWLTVLWSHFRGHKKALSSPTHWAFSGILVLDILVKVLKMVLRVSLWHQIQRSGVSSSSTKKQLEMSSSATISDKWHHLDTPQNGPLKTCPHSNQVWGISESQILHYKCQRERQHLDYFRLVGLNASVHTPYIHPPHCNSSFINYWCFFARALLMLWDEVWTLISCIMPLSASPLVNLLVFHIDLDPLSVNLLLNLN